MFNVIICIKTQESSSKFWISFKIARHNSVCEPLDIPPGWILGDPQYRYWLYSSTKAYYTSWFYFSARMGVICFGVGRRLSSFVGSFAFLRPITHSPVKTIMSFRNKWVRETRPGKVAETRPLSLPCFGLFRLLAASSRTLQRTFSVLIFLWTCFWCNMNQPIIPWSHLVHGVLSSMNTSILRHFWSFLSAKYCCCAVPHERRISKSFQTQWKVPYCEIMISENNTIEHHGGSQWRYFLVILLANLHFPSLPLALSTIFSDSTTKKPVFLFIASNWSISSRKVPNMKQR